MRKSIRLLTDINSAIIDLLKGSVCQVENKVLDKFERGNYEDIQEFIKSVKSEELIIEISPKIFWMLLKKIIS